MLLVMNNCLHDYFTVKNTPNGFRERCRLCGREVAYNRSRDGRINTRKYREERRRDFLQPTGKDKKLFERIYGKAKEIPKNKEPTQEDWEQAKEDAIKYNEKLQRELRDE